MKKRKNLIQEYIAYFKFCSEYLRQLKINKLKTEQQIITVTKKAVTIDALGTKSKTIKLNNMNKIMSLTSEILIFLFVFVKKNLLKFKVKGVAILELKIRKN